jgi:hypothetical protein
MGELNATQGAPAQFALSPSLEAAFAEMRATLPDQVPRAEVIAWCRFYACLAEFEYAADAKESSEEACARIKEADQIVRQMRAILQRTEDEARRILDVLFLDFRIAEDPAFAALHKALVAIMETKH